jgi:ferredoxin--NADP+ reductase/benzoate/toluate 1,2-dioxygenase reductase subunit
MHPPSPPLTAPRRRTVRVLALRALSQDGFELTLERDGLEFRAGQLINLHGRDPLDERSYTVCSGERDPVLQVIFRRMDEGKLTPQLAALRAGDPVTLAGPFGEFTIRDLARPLVFVATGTGVAPARAYQRTHPGLDLTLIHGVRRAEDLFYRDEFAGTAYYPCVSGEPGVGFHGRVTAFCATFPFHPDSHFYLCGANEMFYDMRDVLKARGVSGAAIFTEAYYYRADD